MHKYSFDKADAEILVYSIRNIIRTCHWWALLIPDFLCNWGTPYPLRQALWNGLWWCISDFLFDRGPLIAQWVKRWPADLAVPGLGPTWGWDLFNDKWVPFCTQPVIITHTLSWYDWNTVEREVKLQEPSIHHHLWLPTRNSKWSFTFPGKNTSLLIGLFDCKGFWTINSVGNEEIIKFIHPFWHLVYIRPIPKLKFWGIIVSYFFFFFSILHVLWKFIRIFSVHHYRCAIVQLRNEHFFNFMG